MILTTVRVSWKNTTHYYRPNKYIALSANCLFVITFFAYAGNNLQKGLGRANLARSCVMLVMFENRYSLGGSRSYSSVFFVAAFIATGLTSARCNPLFTIAAFFVSGGSCFVIAYIFMNRARLFLLNAGLKYPDQKSISI